MRPYWPFKDDLAINDGIIMKGRCIIISQEMKKHALDQLDSNHRGIKETRLLACESIWWVNMNPDIENTVKAVLHVLIFSKCSLKRESFTMIYQANQGNHWSRHVFFA